jgi:hypothetical protein
MEGITDRQAMALEVEDGKLSAKRTAAICGHSIARRLALNARIGVMTFRSQATAPKPRSMYLLGGWPMVGKNYPLSIEPNNGTDAAQMGVLQNFVGLGGCTARGPN